MAGVLVPLVLLPRFTTLGDSGTQEFTTIALEVTPYEAAILNAWRGNFVSTAGSPVFKIYFEESTDGTAWSICGGTSATGEVLAAATETQYTATLTKQWFRIRVKIESGTNMAVTCWAVGFLEERQR